jgi:hypothetical protein
MKIERIGIVNSGCDAGFGSHTFVDLPKEMVGK